MRKMLERKVEDLEKFLGVLVEKGELDYFESFKFIAHLNKLIYSGENENKILDLIDRAMI